MHIDDPRVPKYGFPSIKDCVQFSPCQLLEEQKRTSLRFDASSLMLACIPEAMSVIEQNYDTGKVEDMSKIVSMNGMIAHLLE